MATAKKTTIEVPVIQKTAAVELVLTPEEASLLSLIVNNVGGDPQGPRGKLDAIGAALNSAGVLRSEAQLSSHSRSIYFA